MDLPSTEMGAAQSAIRESGLPEMGWGREQDFSWGQFNIEMLSDYQLVRVPMEIWGSSACGWY